MISETSTKQVMKFSWDEVDPRLIKKLLAARAADQNRDLIGVRGVARDEPYLKKLRVAAGKHLGTPLSAKAMDGAVIDVLRTVWLPAAPPDTVNGLYWAIRRTAGPSELMSSKKTQVAWLKDRKITTNLRTNLRKAFIGDHKTKHDVRRTSIGQDGEDLGAARELLGGGEAPTRTLYPHQIASHTGLDALVRSTIPRGVLVLPTGAGKTETLVSWLMQQPSVLAREARVLWLVHQQELVAQSLRRFQALAPTMPEGTVLTARQFFAGASPSTLLAEPNLDIAVATIQSVVGVQDSSRAASRKASPMDPVKRNRLKDFLSKPVFVVIDEAHRAGSKSYQTLLNLIDQIGDPKIVVGLTATPWPTAMGARHRFRETFPTVVHRVESETLIAEGILARPMISVVATGTVIRLTDDELKAAIGGELNPAVLRRLENTKRDERILHTFKADPGRWGKTLVFATSIEHADRLGEAAWGVPCKVLHSQSADTTAEVLDWFTNQTGARVLVSVGKLTEGVDLPDAQTAFLLRPTTSRILLRQMIGRVLRGPRANGTAVANIVYFRDRWANFGEILEPADVMPTSDIEEGGETGDKTRVLPPIDVGGLDLPRDVESEVRRQIEAIRTHSANLDAGGDGRPDDPIDPTLRSMSLAGWYQLDDEVVPVFEHQHDDLVRLLDDALNGASFQGRSHAAYFEDCPTPQPGPRGLRLLVDWTRANGEIPEFNPIRIDVGPHDVGPHDAVKQLDAAGRLTEAERSALLRSVFDQSLNRSVYRSFEEFEERVFQELVKRRSYPNRVDPEQAITTAVTPGRRKRTLPRVEDRNLDPILDSAVTRAQQLLPPHLAHVLGGDLPVIRWSTNVVSSYFGIWTPPKAKAKAVAGQAPRRRITINRLLCTDVKIVSDEMLAYLVYHELLHDLLPGQGHDSEFRDYESQWPDGAQLDVAFDLLDERWDCRAASY